MCATQISIRQLCTIKIGGIKIGATKIGTLHHCAGKILIEFLHACHTTVAPVNCRPCRGVTVGNGLFRGGYPGKSGIDYDADQQHQTPQGHPLILASGVNLFHGGLTIEAILGRLIRFSVTTIAAVILLPLFATALYPSFIGPTSGGGNTLISVWIAPIGKQHLGDQVADTPQFFLFFLIVADLIIRLIATQQEFLFDLSGGKGALDISFVTDVPGMACVHTVLCLDDYIFF